MACSTESNLEWIWTVCVCKVPHLNLSIFSVSAFHSRPMPECNGIDGNSKLGLLVRMHCHFLFALFVHWLCNAVNRRWAIYNVFECESIIVWPTRSPANTTSKRVCLLWYGKAWSIGQCNQMVVGNVVYACPCNIGNSNSSSLLLCMSVVSVWRASLFPTIIKPKFNCWIFLASSCIPSFFHSIRHNAFILAETYSSFFLISGKRSLNIIRFAGERFEWNSAFIIVELVRKWSILEQLCFSVGNEIEKYGIWKSVQFLVSIRMWNWIQQHELQR